MNFLINNYKVSWNGCFYSGSLFQIVNPYGGLSDVGVNELMTQSCNGVDLEHHLLYHELYELGTATPEKLNKMRWEYYRAFYLEAKNSLKAIIANDLQCVSLAETLAKKNSDTYLNDDRDISPSDIIGYGESIGFLTDISEAELDAMLLEIEDFLCNSSTLTESEETIIREALRSYFNANKLNILRKITRSHLVADPLNQIVEILEAKSCN